MVPCVFPNISIAGIEHIIRKPTDLVEDEILQYPTMIGREGLSYG